MSTHLEEREWSARENIREMGRTRIITECPFCEAEVLIYIWSINGCGKKRCTCGASLYRDGIARKRVEDAPAADPASPTAHELAQALLEACDALDTVPPWAPAPSIEYWRKLAAGAHK